MALLFLAISVRPVARLRSAVSPSDWFVALAIAALCGLVDIGLWVAWLMPRG